GGTARRSPARPAAGTSPWPVASWPTDRGPVPRRKNPQAAPPPEGAGGTHDLLSIPRSTRRSRPREGPGEWSAALRLPRRQLVARRAPPHARWVRPAQPGRGAGRLGAGGQGDPGRVGGPGARAPARRATGRGRVLWNHAARPRPRARRLAHPLERPAPEPLPPSARTRGRRGHRPDRHRRWGRPRPLVVS